MKRVRSRTVAGAVYRTRTGFHKYRRAILRSILEAGKPQPPHRGRVHFSRMADTSLSAVWLGHASVLIQLDGVNILTDPVFSHRIGFSFGPLTVGLERLAPAPADPMTLPTIDLILISHAHFDHLDKPTLRALADDRTTVVTARNTSRLIPRGYRRIIELDWGRTLNYRGVRLGAVRPTHWGARKAYDAHRRYNSYLIESPSHNVLFGGDTAMTNAFNDIGPVDLAVMGIGAYEPWEHRHATPEQVWTMFTRCPGRYLLPMHHSTFNLGREHVDEPMQRLLAAADGDDHRVVGRELGDIWRINDARPARVA